MRCGVENPMDADLLIVFEFRGSSMDERKATGTTLPVLHFMVFFTLNCMGIIRIIAFSGTVKAIMRIIPM